MAFNDDDYLKAGPLFITTDRILEERAFYKYSNEMLELLNMNTDNRTTYLETNGNTESNMRTLNITTQSSAALKVQL